MTLFEAYTLAVIFSSIILGFAAAPLFPLFFTIPGEFGMELQVSQSSTICIWASFGEGILSMFVGYLMGIFTPNMIFYGLITFTSLLLLNHLKMLQLFRSIQSEKEKSMKNDLNQGFEVDHEVHDEKGMKSSAHNVMFIP
jgi:hypothetical protein